VSTVEYDNIVHTRATRTARPVIRILAAVPRRIESQRCDLRPGTLRRSVTLLRAFRVEQTDPDYFYSLLARDSVRQLGQYAGLAGRLVLDVGGGPGYFGTEFRRAGARYLTVDSDLGELSARGVPQSGCVLGSGMALPVQTRSVDVCYSSNVLEHVPQPERMADEMVRVTRPGGTVFLSYTTWLSPWGGHETAPWHYLSGDYAARRYQRRHGRPPKNRYGQSLFPLSAARMLRWARRHPDVRLVAALPRYHPSWARWLVRLAGVREVAVWNLLLVLRRR
jgi:SAM-dependent methyltransferase